MEVLFAVIFGMKVSCVLKDTSYVWGKYSKN